MFLSMYTGYAESYKKHLANHPDEEPLKDDDVLLPDNEMQEYEEYLKSGYNDIVIKRYPEEYEKYKMIA